MKYLKAKLPSKITNIHTASNDIFRLWVTQGIFSGSNVCLVQSVSEEVICNLVQGNMEKEQTM